MEGRTMAKHSKNKGDTPKTVFLAPCEDCYEGMVICSQGFDKNDDATLTRVFSNYDDALSYVKACGWLCCIEDAIVEVTVGSL